VGWKDLKRWKRILVKMVDWQAVIRKGHKILSVPFSASLSFVTSLNLPRRLFRDKLSSYSLIVTPKRVFLSFFSISKKRYLRDYFCIFFNPFLRISNVLRPSISKKRLCGEENENRPI